MFEKERRYSFKQGLPKHVFSTPFFSIRYEKSERGSVGVVVSKKVSKKAVVRNRVKRKMVALLEKHLGDEMAYDIVVYMKRGVVDAYDTDIEHALHSALRTLQ